jgi:hypothetical protein
MSDLLRFAESESRRRRKLFIVSLPYALVLFQFFSLIDSITRKGSRFHVGVISDFCFLQKHLLCVMSVNDM